LAFHISKPARENVVEDSTISSYIDVQCALAPFVSIITACFKRIVEGAAVSDMQLLLLVRNRLV
jgi:hypothetical protein